eukprot:scaffold776_cov347-Pavlova_lutheri.AAC.158
MDPVTSMLHAWCRNSIHHVAPVLEEGIPCWMVQSQLQVLTQEASLLPPMGDAFVQIKIECAFQCKRKYTMKHSKLAYVEPVVDEDVSGTGAVSIDIAHPTDKI